MLNQYKVLTFVFNMKDKIKYYKGGKRPGSGRKASTNKKVQVCLYVYSDTINALDGVEAVKSIAYNAIDGSLRSSVNSNTDKV